MNILAPTKHQLLGWQGAAVEARLVARDDFGRRISLAGQTARMQIRHQATFSSALLLDLSSDGPNMNGSGLTVESDGSLFVAIAAEDIAGLAALSCAYEPLSLVYSVLALANDGVGPIQAFWGQLLIQPSVAGDAPLPPSAYLQEAGSSRLIKMSEVGQLFSPLTAVAASGPALTLTFNGPKETIYDIVLTADCELTVGGVGDGSLYAAPFPGQSIVVTLSGPHRWSVANALRGSSAPVSAASSEATDKVRFTVEPDLTIGFEQIWQGATGGAPVQGGADTDFSEAGNPMIAILR